MARSVNYLNDSLGVAYINATDWGYEDGEYDEFLGEILWEDFIYDLKSTLQAKYPSLEEDDNWEGNEVHIILSNQQTNIAVSEYMGLVSISVAPKEDWYGNAPSGLALRNTKFIAKFVEETFSDLKKVGCFSNGECIYEAA